MSLPIFKGNDTNLQLMQSNWSSQLNPILSNPITNPTLLSNITLKTGTNVINHLHGSTPVGWFITDTNSGVQVYRSAPFNNLTLTLTSSGPAVVGIAVF